jgi:hypothetical protein
MFEVPVRIIGVPGSGKTMLATLAEFRMVEKILKDVTYQTNRTLAAALGQAGFLRDGRPHVAAVRVPMESEYRDFWELPYDPAIKTQSVTPASQRCDAHMRSSATQPTHNRAIGRDFVDIRMQGDEKKDVSRRQFRAMARDMAKRYLPMVEGLRNRNATDIDRLVPNESPALSAGQIKELAGRVDKDQRTLGIGASRRQEIDGGKLAYPPNPQRQIALRRAKRRFIASMLPQVTHVKA